MDKEIWKPIQNYEGKYYVSTFGRIKNSNNVILKPMVCSNGYLAACLWKNSKQKKILIHRLVASAFLKNDNFDLEVNHIDENKMNNILTNLEWCNHKYNMNYGNVGKKISLANKGRQLSEEQKRNCASAIGRKWIHSSNTERLIKMEEIPSFLIKGWNLGRL